MGLFALALYYRFGFGFEFIVGFVFVAALVVISFVDLNVRIVPGMVRLLGDWFRTLLFGQGFLLSNTGIVPSLSSLINVRAGDGFLSKSHFASKISLKSINY